REVTVGDVLQRRPRAELHAHPPLPVPPAKARDARVVAVQDAGLCEGRGRGHAAAVWVDDVALTLDKATCEGHLAIVERGLERAHPKPVHVEHADALARHHAARSSM